MSSSWLISMASASGSMIQSARPSHVPARYTVTLNSSSSAGVFPLSGSPQQGQASPFLNL